MLTSIQFAVFSVYESVGEVLKFTIAAAHKIDIVGESWVAYGPSINGDGCMVAKYSFLHDLIQEQTEQDGGE